MACTGQGVDCRQSMPAFEASLSKVVVNRRSGFRCLSGLVSLKAICLKKYMGCILAGLG